MSTVREQLNRVVKSFTLVAQRDDYSVVIPPQILVNARAAVFFKKIPRGTQKGVTAVGLFFKRIGRTAWSNPVCVYMHRSDVYWGKLPRVDRSDVLVLFSDPEIINTFEMYGQIGFTDHCGKLKRGIMMEDSDAGRAKLAEMLSDQPQQLRDDDAFVYGLCDGRVFSIDIETFMLRVKDTSNRKWYDSRDANARDILAGAVLCPHPDKAGLIACAHAALSRYVDISERHPELASLAEHTDYTLQPQCLLASPPASVPALSSHGSATESFYSASASDYGSSASLNAGSPSPSDSAARDRGWSQASEGSNNFGDYSGFGGAMDVGSGRGPALSVASQYPSRRNSTLSAKSRGSSLGGWDDADDGAMLEHVAGFDQGLVGGSLSGSDNLSAPSGRPRAPSERRPSERRPSQLETIHQHEPLGAVPRSHKAAAEEAAAALAAKMQDAGLDPPAPTHVRVNSFDFA